jgi:hypothetical protein
MIEDVDHGAKEREGAKWRFAGHTEKLPSLHIAGSAGATSRNATGPIEVEAIAGDGTTDCILSTL